MSTTNQDFNRFESSTGEEVWIGIVQVEPTELSEIIEHDEGAYVPVLALGKTKNDYIKKIYEYAEYYHLQVIEIDEIETFAAHMSTRKVTPEFIRMAEEVLATGSARNGVFNCYPLDE